MHSQGKGKPRLRATLNDARRGARLGRTDRALSYGQHLRQRPPSPKVASGLNRENKHRQLLPGNYEFDTLPLPLHDF